MAITASDIKFKLSTTAGAAGNSNSGTPSGSLGKYISTTELSGTALNNLFDDISGDENAASDVEYRIIFIHNSHGSLTYQSPKVWLGGPRFTAEADDDTFTSAGHGFSDGQMVRLEASLATDTLPTGVNNSTTYYVRDASTDTFKLASTLGGSAINISADGTGEARKYGTTTVALALDNIAASAIGASAAQADDIANESTAPDAVGSYSSPTTKSGGISIGNLQAGYCVALTVRRTAGNTAAKNNDGIMLRIAGDTAE